MRSFSVAVVVAVAAIFGSSGVAVAAPKDYCADLKGGKTGSTCEIQLSDPAYSVDISFPLVYPDQKSVADYISQTRDAFLNSAKSGAPRTTPYAVEHQADGIQLVDSPARHAGRGVQGGPKRRRGPAADDVQGVQLGPELSQGDHLHGRTGRQRTHAVVAGGRSAEDRRADRAGRTAAAAGTAAAGRAAHATWTAGYHHATTTPTTPPPPPPPLPFAQPRCTTLPTIRISRWSTTG